MSRPILVYGAGGHGREVAALIDALSGAGGGWVLKGWLDDDRSVWGQTVAGAPVLGDGEWLRGHPGAAVALGIGDPRRRKQVVGRIQPYGPEFPALVDPIALVMARAVIGHGSIIMAGAVVSVDAAVGSFCALNLRVTVNHDCQIMDFGTLGPGTTLAGNVTIGQGTELGAGAICIPGVSVGDWAMIGAGAVVIADLPGHATAAGVPARVLPPRRA